MTCDIVKVLVSLCVVTAIVGGQSLRGQSSRFGAASGNVGSQLWDRENPATSQFDQFPLQSSSRFSIPPRTSRLSGPYAVQAQRNLQTFQQRNDQRQQNQISRELQQQRQQRLQQLQNNRILQSRSRYNMLLRASNGINRQTQRSEMNRPVASSRIPLVSQQRRQRQQPMLSRDAPRLGFEENSLSSSPWNEELPRGIIQSSLGSFSERTRITDPNQQQQIWQQRRINNMLRRQKNEKHRAEQLTLQSRQQEEKMHRLLLQEQQEKQHWHTQQPEVPTTNGAINTATLKSHETTAQQAGMSHAQSVTSSVKDQVQLKQERIHQLAGILGFKPSDLFKAIAELEASKVSLGTSTLTDQKANRLANQITPDVVSTTSSLNIGEVLPIFNSGVQKVMGDNVVKVQPFRQEIPQYPPILYTAEITSSATSAPAIIIQKVMGDNVVKTQPFRQEIPQYPPILYTAEITSSATSAPAIIIQKVMGDNVVKTQPFRQEIPQYPPILYTAEITSSATSAPAIIITESASTIDSSNTIAGTVSVAVNSVTNRPFPSSASNTTTGASMETRNAGKQISDSHFATDAQQLLNALLRPMASQTLLADTALSSATKTLLMQIQNLISNSNKTVHMDNNSSNTIAHINGNNSNNVAIPHDNSGQFVNSPMNAQPETVSINNVLENGTTEAPVIITTMGPKAWNITDDMMFDWNVTMTPTVTTTMELNITTTVVTEATEAVPTAPPPPPGFPHMFEALPGQELTEAQLEYNEMREAMMAK